MILFAIKRAAWILGLMVGGWAVFWALIFVAYAIGGVHG